MAFPIRQLPKAQFPELLREIPDAPSLLYIRGELPPRDKVLLCVVGSRACTIYGRRMTQKLIAGLRKYPVTIVSGLALGIDAEAHKAALDVGLPAIAVLPSSLEDEAIYPKTNYLLAQRILKEGGALVSEHSASFRPYLHSFPERDRIMAGLACASLIIEAGEKSGTLITARLALDYNREVLAIPHELGRETGEGVNRLIREGATLVRNSEDVLQALGLKSDEPEQTTLPTDLTDIEIKILEALTHSLVRDELIEKAELSAQEANIAVSSLLIRGLLVERLGKIERI